MRFAIFRPDGTIDRIATLTFGGDISPEAMLTEARKQAVHEGEDVIAVPEDFTGDDTTHHVVDGQLAPIP